MINGLNVYKSVGTLNKNATGYTKTSWGSISCSYGKFSEYFVEKVFLSACSLIIAVASVWDICSTKGDIGDMQVFSFLWLLICGVCFLCPKLMYIAVEWRTQEFFSGGGVQQIQLRTEDRTGIWGAVAPLVRGSGGICNLVQ